MKFEEEGRNSFFVFSSCSLLAKVAFLVTQRFCSFVEVSVWQYNCKYSMKCCARLTMFEVIKKIILIVKSIYRSYYIYNREFQLFVYKYRYCNITTEIVRKRFDEVWYVNKNEFSFFVLQSQSSSEGCFTRRVSITCGTITIMTMNIL